MRDQVTPLVEPSVDAAIVRLPASHPDVVVAPFAQEPRVLTVGASHEPVGETSVHADEILGLPTLPLDARPETAHFWLLNDERGGGNYDRGASPAQTVAEAQFTISVPGASSSRHRQRWPGWPQSLRVLCPAHRRGADPSVIAVAP